MFSGTIKQFTVTDLSEYLSPEKEDDGILPDPVLDFTEKRELKMDYSLLVVSDDTLRQHIFVIGGTCPINNWSIDYSPNYILTPVFTQQDGSDKKELEIIHTFLPELNQPRSHCSLVEVGGYVFVLFGQGAKNLNARR